MRRLRRALLPVAGLVVVVGSATAAGVAGTEQARAHRIVAEPPVSDWSAPTSTVAPPVSPVSTAAPAVTIASPADGPLSRYFAGTLRLRNIQPAVLGVGTAFVIGDGTLALTNRHVVADATSLELESWDGRLVGTATVLAVGPQTTDLALLRLPTALAGALPLSPVAAPVDTELTAGGYPEAVQLTRSVGRLRALTTQDGMAMMVTDVPAAPGSSGSPLLDGQGRVVGVIFGGSFSGYTLAVPVSEALALLASQNITL